MTSFKKKIKHIRVRRSINQYTVQYSSIELSSIKLRPTFGLQVFGFFLTICLGFVGLLVEFTIATLFVSLIEKIFPAHNVPDLLIAIGILLSLFCTCTVSPLLRRFCYHLKHAYLRDAGIVAEATVVGYKRSISARGPEQIDLIVVWQHPVTGQTYHYERHYTFFWELFSEKKADIFKGYYAGAYLPLVFNPKHPRYFVLEVPFVPCWFDTLF